MLHASHPRLSAFLAAFALVGCGSSGAPSAEGSVANAVAASVAGGGDASTVFRFDLAGYSPDADARIYMMSSDVWTDARVSVNGTATSTKVGDDLGAWSATFRHVYPIDLPASTRGGDLLVLDVADGPAMVESPAMTNHMTAYGALASASFEFFQAQRDGKDVVSGFLDRKPSHLADATAKVYATPKYVVKDGGDVLDSKLTPTGKTIDASGGWFDAGDYLKFTETTSYALVPLSLALRDHGSFADPPALDELKFGIDWLMRMYDDASGTLYIQVGIGDGNDQVMGDHDGWRLPEKDDELHAKPGDADYFVEYRPVFADGAKLSPNLAGRLAADFALCSQVVRAGDPSLADQCLLYAEHVYALADTSPSKLTTTVPYDYYPETTWRDDLELGAAEIANALEDPALDPSVEMLNLPEPSASFYLQESAHWASEYIAKETGDTLNLYDVSALAHSELIRAAYGSFDGLDVSMNDLRGDLEDQLATGIAASKHDPFGAGADLTQGDVAPHLFGLAVTARLYDAAFSTTMYESFAEAQLHYLLGANAWGRAFVVLASGGGPQCLHHQIANLKGALDGGSPLLFGAVVDGPDVSSDFHDLGSIDGARPCDDELSQFDTEEVRFVDEVTAWPSVEPALDYTAISALAFAQAADLTSGGN